MDYPSTTSIASRFSSAFGRGVISSNQRVTWLTLRKFLKSRLSSFGSIAPGIRWQVSGLRDVVAASVLAADMQPLIGLNENNILCVQEMSNIRRRFRSSFKQI